jgi:hypothetical protein
MFRLLGVILRPSIEPNQDFLITSALWDPVVLTIVGVNAMWNYSLVFKMTVGSVGAGLFCGCINTTYCKRYGIPECTSYLTVLVRFNGGPEDDSKESKL